MTHTLLLALTAACLGALGKYADLLNEHGMKPLFRELPLLSGILWGLSGLAVMLLSPAAGITYTAHILYWFLRIKLEYPNHASAGVIILLGALLMQGTYYQEHAHELFLVFLGYTLSGYIHAYLKARYLSWHPFLRLRLRIYFVPLIYSLYLGDKDPFLATCFGMLACELVTLYLPHIANRWEARPKQ